MYKVLAYDADGFGWALVCAHGNRERARAAAFLVRGERAFQWVALVRVTVAVADGAALIEVVESDAPNAGALPGVQQFREAAAAKAVTQ